jgi:hypothetical protein
MGKLDRLEHSGNIGQVFEFKKLFHVKISRNAATTTPATLLFGCFWA